MEPLTLYELNNRVRRSLSQSLPDEYWVQAELSDVRINSAGHCYVEFVQKDVHSNAFVAKARGVVWGHVFRLLRPYFERETGQIFTSGIKVMVLVRVEFHEVYGYSLTVVDIDPSYTVGDMVRRRREILQQLENEGVLTLNKELSLTVIPQRIAVISSSTAAGYGDFCNQLESNPYGFRFYPTLFPAVMQGDKVEESILEAFDAILATVGDWDVVVIIRGGGAVSDLAGFDSYMLATACAQFPLPVITGIGHERDDTVLDFVAHTRVKTPTAAAEFLISRVHEAALALEAKADYIDFYVHDRLQVELHRIEEMTRRLPVALTIYKLHAEHRIDNYWQRIRIAVTGRVQTESHRLQLIGHRVEACDYNKLLKRGFGLVMKEGRVVTDVSSLKVGEPVILRLSKGEALAQIISVKCSEMDEMNESSMTQNKNK